MQRIRISQIEVGTRFDEALFLPNGQKLLGAGVTLSDRHIQALRRSGESEILIAQNLEELIEAGALRQVQRVSSSALRVGARFGADLMTSAGQVVLEAGEAIEDHHLHAFEAAGDVFVREDGASPAEADDGQSGPDRHTPAERRERILMADVLADDLEQRVGSMPMRIRPGTETDWIKPKPPETWHNRQQLIKEREKMVRSLGNLYARIEAGVSVPAVLFDPILDDLMRRLSEHQTRVTQLALLVPRQEDYLPDHAYTVTVLAMSIGANLRWPENHVRQIGLAGLLYDLGMLLVPERIRVGACELTEMDRARVQKHPILSLSMQQSISDVPAIVQLAALQHHERENGTGYPRHRRKDQICDYARVLAVADTYAAITEPRHYRDPKLPYIAMEETLRNAAALQFWSPAVRALVQAAGLFPVGSYVKLSNRRNAVVLSANPGAVDRPVIQLLDDQGESFGEPLDLARIEKSKLAVVRAVPEATGV